MGALAFTEQAFAVQVGDDLGQVIVVGAFAAHVRWGQADAEAVVNGLAVAQGYLVEFCPQVQAVIVAGLQLYHQGAGAVGEGVGFVEALFGGPVKGFQVGQLAA